MADRDIETAADLAIDCARCNDTGEVYTPGNHPYYWDVCPDCDGDSRLAAEPDRSEKP